MRITTLLILLLWAQIGISQNTTDLEIVQQAYAAQNPNVSLELLSQVKDMSSLPDTIQNMVYLSFGIAYGKLGKADSSTYFLNKCIENAKDSQDDYSLMRAYNSKGVLLRIQGNHEGSLHAFQSSEKVAERNTKLRFLKAKSDIFGNIGGIFYQLKDYTSARRYSQKGLRIAKQYKDTSELAYGYLRLAIVAQAEDSLSLSLNYNKMSSQYLEALGDFNTLAYVQSNLGNIYKDQEDYERALFHHKRASEFAEMLGDVETKSHAILSIGESHFQLGRFKKAREFANKGLEIAEKSHFPIQSKNAHDLLFRIAEKEGNFKEALEEKKLSVAVNDSLNAAEARERLADVETKYETEKKEAEIARLSLENDLKDLRISTIAISGGVLIIILIILFILRSKRLKVEAEAQEFQIEALKKQLMELNSTTTDLASNIDFEELNGKLHTPLTEREFDALKLSVQGKTNSEIAEELFITNSTVKFHLRNTYSKMGVVNRKEAFQYVAKT